MSTSGSRLSAIIAASLVAGSTGLAGQPFGPMEYSAYAYADCGATNTPAVRFVLLTGAVPATIPAALPRPSIELVVYATAESVTAQSIPVAPDAEKTGKGAAARSCPVVGACTLAQSGSISIERREDGRLRGEFRATWTGTPERAGSFIAAWRAGPRKC